MYPEKWQKIKAILERAIEVAPENRAEFLDKICADDAELRQEVESYLAEEYTESLENDAFAVLGEDEIAGNISGQKIDDYEILELLGEGGMGAVYLAEHRGEGFSQRVALKLIKRGMDTNAVLRRFLTERQILASLEHPNIARLLDGGSTASGLPYFVMEYIEGEPLREFCENHQFDTNERLELFLKICNAVSYAHQNLVVHRDIKPSNIIVTSDGTPKLLDFGIGKVLSPNWNVSTEEATRTQMRLMTPEYASPEQLRGQMTTTATDVYSLGVVLYELLTETRPYKFDSTNPLEISEKILTQEPLRPSSVVSRSLEIDGQQKIQNPKSKIQNLKGDLDNIILKAIRKETERRYKSVQELADDIERFLKGLPVSATADSRLYRVQKFVQRHRTGVSAAAAFALLLIAATAVTSWQYFKAQRAQAKAEQRFNDVRKLANSVVFELHDSIQNLPGATPARELLVSRALEYLDELANEAETDAALQTELADAYDKIGDVQGGYGEFHLGQRDKAKESYEKALAIKTKLLESEPNNFNLRRKIAAGFYKIGNMKFLEANLDESLSNLKKTLEIYQILVEESPNNLELKQEYSKALSRTGYVLAASGNLSESDEYALKGITINEKLVESAPNEENFLMNLANSYESYGQINNAAKQDYSTAHQYFEKTFQISEKLHLANPQNVLIKYRYGSINYHLALSHYNIAWESKNNQRKLNALDNIKIAQKTFEELNQTDSKNKLFYTDLAVIETTLSRILLETGKIDEAIEILEQSLQKLNRQKEDEPNNQSIVVNIGNIYANLGDAYFELGKSKKSVNEKINNFQNSRNYLQKSYEVYKPLRDAGKITGNEAERVEKLKKAIAECDAALEKLK